jgi:hypothetical protein
MRTWYGFAHGMGLDLPDQRTVGESVRLVGQYVQLVASRDQVTRELADASSNRASTGDSEFTETLDHVVRGAFRILGVSDQLL